ncbi:MAG: hypothetical protein D6718_01690 [Acidobacteria bacterium]|nr:MAG: hypothetical protein D6718_01690 [Acidobacteriota bacterium]
MAEFDSVIPPGGQGKVVAKVHTKGQQGRRTKTISVQTDDPVRPNVTLRLSFEARPAVAVYPAPTVNLVAVQGEKAEASLLLRRGDGAPLRVEAVEASRPGVEAEAVPVEEDQPAEGRLPAAHAGDWKVRIRLASTREPRSETGRLHIRTDHPEQRDLSIPLRIQVRPAVEASPKAVSLRVTPGEAPRPAVVILRHNGHRRFRIAALKLEGELPGIRVRGGSGDPAPVQRAEIVVDPSAPPGRHTGKLIVRVAVGKKKLPPVEVPVTVEVAAQDGGSL